jgi:hypothetical protein
LNAFPVDEVVSRIAFIARHKSSIGAVLTVWHGDACDILKTVPCDALDVACPGTILVARGRKVALQLTSSTGVTCGVNAPCRVADRVASSGILDAYAVAVRIA